MRFKHLLFTTSLVCGVAATIMSLYAMHWTDVVSRIDYVGTVSVESEMVLMRALNFVMPLGIFCIGLLLWVWRADRMGVFAMLLLIVSNLIAVDLGLRAVKKVHGEKIALSKVAWWAPQEDQPRPVVKKLRKVAHTGI